MVKLHLKAFKSSTTNNFIMTRVTKSTFEPVVQKYERELKGKSIAKALEESNH